MNHNHQSHSTTRHGASVSHTVSDFLPLIAMLALVVIFTFAASIYTNQFDPMALMRHFMAGFFLIFGGLKVLRLRGFVDAYRVYDIIAKRSRLYGYAYPFIELGLGAAYLFSFSLVITNIVTVVVMGVGAIGVANELLKKNQIPCACLGTVFKIPMTKVTLFEDLLMAAMALWMLVFLL